MIFGVLVGMCMYWLSFFIDMIWLVNVYWFWIEKIIDIFKERLYDSVISIIFVFLIVLEWFYKKIEEE